MVPGVQWFPWRSAQLASSGASVSPFAQGVRILCAIRDLSVPKSAFVWDGSWFGHPGTQLIDEYAGTPSLRQMIDAGLDSAQIVQTYEAEVALFRHQRKQYLLY